MANLIKVKPVPLIFKEILKNSLSGELAITHENFAKKLFFLEGDLIFASTSLAHERLGEVLKSTGKITASQLNQATEIMGSSTRKTGEILAEVTHLNLKDIYSAILYQIKIIAAATFFLREGAWEFTENIPKIKDNQRFRIKLPQVIVEGVKQIIDISYFMKRFFYRAPLTAPIPESIRKYLTAQQIELHQTLENFPDTSVEEIIPKLKVPENVFWKNIICLYLLNIADFVELTMGEDEEVNKNIEEINQLYEQINSSQMNYYRLLGIEKSATPEELKERYFQLSRKYHPDRVPETPDSDIKEKANAVLAEINMAYEILSDKEKKGEYDLQRYKQDPRLNLTGSAPIQANKAKELYQKANACYKEKRYFEAVSLLEEAVEADNTKAPYFLLLGLCLSKSSSDIEKIEGEKNLRKAAEMEPWNIAPLFALAELYRSRNLLEEAEIYFDKVLKIETGHSLALKAKREIKALSKKNPISSLFKKKQ